MNRRPMSDSRRQKLSEIGKRRWDRMSGEAKAEMRERQRATYQAEHADQVVLRQELRRQIEAGEIDAEPCDRCGVAGMPMLRGLEVIGWRCYPCRRATTDA